MRQCIGAVTIRRQLDDMQRESPNQARRSPVRNSRFLRLLLMSVSGVALTALSAGSAAAQVAWTGTTNNDWTVGTNWLGGVAPVAGNTVVINTTSPNPTVLGVGGPAVGTTGQMIVGNTTGSFGNLTIQNGSTLTSTSAGFFQIGADPGSNGTVTVTGAGSQWITSGSQLRVGVSGNGALNIQNGAQVIAQGGVVVGTLAGGTGTLNINGGSTLETNSLGHGAGSTGQVNFDNAILRARTNNAIGFVGGFSPGTLNIAAGGLTVDTQAFTVGASSGFSGVGGLTKIGAGTLNLRALNTYTGETVIQTGTLSLASSGSIAASSRVVANGTFNISGITAAGTNIQSLAGSGAVVLGAKNLTITNANDMFAGIIGGTGGLTVSGGTQTLSGANNYTGATTVNGGTLQAGAAGAFSAASAYATLAGGTLNLNGFNQTIASLDNAGTVNLGGAPGTTLTVAGNYIGSGGVVNLNAALGGDASATDRLVVQGNTSGSSTLQVTNVGGGGAQTVEGIKIVDVVGASNGIFALQGDYVFHGQQAVIGGAFAYTLQKNGIATPGDGDWYLRSSLINPPPVVPAGPIYQPGVPLYEAFPQVLLALNTLPTLQQRVGNRYRDINAVGTATAPSGSETTTEPNVFWGRTEGSYGSFKPDGSTTVSGANIGQWKARTGLDGLLYANQDGTLIGGVTAHFGTAIADVRSKYGDGRISTTGTGFGGTLTWYGESGFYVDGQTQATFFNSNLRSDLVGREMANGIGGFGYAMSVETGKRFGATGPWSLTPQAQLVYSAVGSDFRDNFGAQVTLGRSDSLNGRLGMALNHQKTWSDSSGIVRSDVYGIANLHYEFLNGTSVDVAGTGFASAQDRLWGSIGGGGTYSWGNGRYTIFGEISYNASLANGGDNSSYKGTGGFRAIW